MNTSFAFGTRSSHALNCARIIHIKNRIALWCDSACNRDKRETKGEKHTRSMLRITKRHRAMRRKMKWNQNQIYSKVDRKKIQTEKKLMLVESPWQVWTRNKCKLITIDVFLQNRYYVLGLGAAIREMQTERKTEFGVWRIPLHICWTEEFIVLDGLGMFSLLKITRFLHIIINDNTIYIYSLFTGETWISQLKFVLPSYSFDFLMGKYFIWERFQLNS